VVFTEVKEISGEEVVPVLNKVSPVKLTVPVFIKGQLKRLPVELG